MGQHSPTKMKTKSKMTNEIDTELVAPINFLKVRKSTIATASFSTLSPGGAGGKADGC